MFLETKKRRINENERFLNFWNERKRKRTFKKKSLIVQHQLYLIKIINSYLSNRIAIISHPHSSADVSNTSDLEVVCPQGSVLSPVLRLTFSFPFSVIVYSDDLVLLSQHKNISMAHANHFSSRGTFTPSSVHR